MLFFTIELILIFIVFFFVKPKTGILLLFIFRPIVDMQYDSSIAIMEVNPCYIISLSAPALLLFYAFHKRINIFIIPKSKIVLLFVASQIISYLMMIVNNAYMVFEASIYLLKLINGFVFFFVMPFIFQTKEDMEDLVNAIFLSVIMPIAVTLYINYFGAEENFVISSGILRLKGLYHDPFSAGFYSLIIIFIGFLKINRIKDFVQKLLLWFIVGMGGYALYKTYSRMNWVGVAAGLIFFCMIKKKFMIGILIMALLVSVYSFMPDVQQRLANEMNFLKGESQIESVGGGRGRLSMYGVNLFIKGYNIPQKLFGVFLSHPDMALPEVQFLASLLRTGITGFLFLVFMLVAIAKQLLAMIIREEDPVLNDFYTLAGMFFLSYTLAFFAGWALSWVHVAWIVWSMIGISLLKFKNKVKVE